MNEEVSSKIIDALVNDGYIVIEKALDTELTQKLLNKAKQTPNYKDAGISSQKAKHIDRNKRSDKTSWLDEDGGSISEYLSVCESLRKYLNQSLYLGLTYYESHFALYEKGSFYEKHLDAFRGSKNRVVTTLFYLNETRTEADGGELVLYDKEGEVLQKVLPKGGTLVIFMSDMFPHEVLESHTDRYSIAGWFRVDKR